MEKLYYSAEKGVQMVLTLLKEHGIRRIIVSPGATNITFVASAQRDDYFTLYSCVDERSAAYMACGMAEAAGEPIVLSCTGATASRNYMPGLTEAYYRRLPVVVLTSSQDNSRIGNLIPQVTDRSQPPKDTVVESVHIPLIKDNDDAWFANLNINKALLALKLHGGGPVHINLVTSYDASYNVLELKSERKVERYTLGYNYPSIPKGRVAIFVGSHSVWSDEEISAIDDFCGTYDAVVFCDHTSNYQGKYRVNNALLGSQKRASYDIFNVDLLIHIGDMSGGYPNIDRLSPVQVWRVSADGKLADHYRKLTAVFEMEEKDFFKAYSKAGGKHAFYDECIALKRIVDNEMPDLPFSNAWVAQNTLSLLPENSVLYLGILNSLRVWNLFDVNSSISCYSNVGGFGIEGGISSLIGMSLIHPDTIHYCVIGDLSFFYDMNILGNHHVGNNVRILLINNGRGVEFRLPNNQGARFGERTDDYIAAAGHFGNQSPDIVRHLAADWGFSYYSAKSKEEYLTILPVLTEKGQSDKPIICEIFIDYNNEVNSHSIIRDITVDHGAELKSSMKGIARGLMGDKLTSVVKSVIGKK